MEFDVEIRFVGLIGAVPDDDWKAVELEKVMLLLPKADSEYSDLGKSEIDKTPRSRHRAYLEYAPENVKGAASHPPHTVGMWMLTGPKRQFRLTFESDNEAKLDTPKLDLVADMTAVAPSDCQLATEAVTSPPPDYVSGQILIDRGKLESLDSGNLVDWSFPRTLSNDPPQEAKLSHEFELKFKAENKLIVKVSSWEDSTETPENLTLGPVFEEGEPLPVKLTIAHLCDLNTLRWQTADLNAQADEDFRWYFEMRSDVAKQQLGKKLYSLDLPIPYPTKAPSAQGRNCLGAKFPKVKF